MTPPDRAATILKKPDGPAFTIRFGVAPTGGETALHLETYPRPHRDTGIGFHLCTGAPSYTADKVAFWVRELKELGASWLVLPADFPTAIPEQALAELIANDIEPVVAVRRQPIAPLDTDELCSQLRRYSALGVHYVHLFHEPNSAAMWEPAEWPQPNLVGRFMETLLPGLESVLDNGLFPVLTSLCPGGHFWDTTFLDASLDWLNNRGKQDIYERLCIGIENYASNRPLTWGQGGRKRWPSARPYRCPSGCQDHRGFRLFEWYDEIVRTRVGRSLPLLCTENGLVIGTRNSPEFPVVDEHTHAERTLEMARQLMEGEAPEYLLNNAFWVLEAGEGESFEGHAWYKRDGSRVPAVTALKGMPKRGRTTTQEPARRPAKVVAFARYLLLPALDGAHRPLRADDLLDLAVRYRLTFGFSLDEAQQARQVILLGGTDELPLRVETQLREAGCAVVRITPADSPWATERRLVEALEAERRRPASRPGRHQRSTCISPISASIISRRFRSGSPTPTRTLIASCTCSAAHNMGVAAGLPSSTSTPFWGRSPLPYTADRPASPGKMVVTWAM